MIDQIEWGSMDVDGRVFEERLADIQDFYIRNKLIARKFTCDEFGPLTPGCWPQKEPRVVAGLDRVNGDLN
jgi:hypothetical protein